MPTSKCQRLISFIIDTAWSRTRSRPTTRVSIPSRKKCLPAQRLNEQDALALYRTGDILAVGWLANHVRERMHGDKAYFNVNRHINPTNVCVAACRLCAFGRKKDAPGAYTMALEEAFETAASGYTEAVTEFHIVGGLHPDLPFEYFLDLCSA